MVHMFPKKPSGEWQPLIGQELRVFKPQLIAGWSAFIDLLDQTADEQHLPHSRFDEPVKYRKVS